MKIIDCFMFYNEIDILKIRLEELYDVVDYFIIIEATLTHNNTSKPLYFKENKHLFDKYESKIIHHITDFSIKYDFVNYIKVPNDNWFRENYQRECASIFIKELNLNDDEIASIMGHEIAHALREHGRERLSQSMAQSAVANIAMAVAGPYGSAVSAANQAAQYVLVLPNSRQNESEADAIGLELAARAGYNPKAAISVWQKMNKATEGKGTFEFLSTHPSGDTRIEQLTELMPAVEPLYIASAKNAGSKHNTEKIKN